MHMKNTKHNTFRKERCKNMAMSEKGKEARAAYMREWRRAHKDKCREYREKHWEKKAAQGEPNTASEKK